MTLAFDCPLPPGTDKQADKTLKNAIFKHEPQKTGKTLTKMPVFEHGLKKIGGYI